MNTTPLGFVTFHTCASGRAISILATELVVIQDLGPAGTTIKTRRGGRGWQVRQGFAEVLQSVRTAQDELQLASVPR
jgi:hypothetical protein